MIFVFSELNGALNKNCNSLSEDHLVSDMAEPVGGEECDHGHHEEGELQNGLFTHLASHADGEGDEYG